MLGLCSNAEMLLACLKFRARTNSQRSDVTTSTLQQQTIRLRPSNVGKKTITIKFLEGTILRNLKWLNPCGCSAVTLLFAAAPSFAQTAGDPTQLAEIVVTAQKREQSINSVGMTITAASSEDLQERQIKSVSDLAKLVPGFNASESGFSTPVYTMRGIGLYDHGLSSASPIAVYVDQVALPFPTMTLGATLDVERMEVLKGPQGTLFGQSSTGGAINYIAAKPTDTFAAGLNASFERFNKLETEGFISGPVSDTVRARLSARVVQGGAWQDSISEPNQKNGETRQVIGRLILDAEPTDKLKLSLNLNGWRDKSDPQAGEYTGSLLNIVAAPDPRNPNARVDPAAFASITTPGSPNYDSGFVKRQNDLYNRAVSTAPDARADQARIVINGPNGDGTAVTGIRSADWSNDFMRQSHNNFYQGALRGDYELSDALTLTSLSSYERVHIDQALDKDGVTARAGDIVFHGTVKTFSQELRLAGDADRLHWVVGGNYDDTDAGDTADVYLIDSSASEPLPGLRFEGGINSVKQKIKTWAGFANAEVNLTESITALAGLRYTKSKQTGSHCSTGGVNAMKLFGNADILPGFGYYDFQTGLGLPAAGHVVVQPGQCAAFDDTLPPTDPGYLRPILDPFKETLKEDNLSYRTGLNYQFDQGTLLYATVSRGYKAGLISGQVGTTVSQYAPAKQEKVMAYEAGIKAPLFDRRAQFNAAAFYYDYSDKQLRIKVLDPIFALLETLANVPKSEIYGLEAELVARPIEGLMMSVSGTYLHSEVTSSFTNSAGRALFNQAGYSGDFKGSPLPFTPKFSAVADAQYTVPIADKYRAFAGGTLTYQSKDNTTFHTDILRADDFYRPAHALLGLRVGLSDSSDRWRFSIYGENVTDKEYETAYYGTDNRFRYTGLPATYGMSLNVQFN